MFDLFDIKYNGILDFEEFVRVFFVFYFNVLFDKKIDCKFSLIIVDMFFFDICDVKSFYLWLFFFN